MENMHLERMHNPNPSFQKCVLIKQQIYYLSAHKSSFNVPKNRNAHERTYFNL